MFRSGRSVLVWSTVLAIGSVLLVPDYRRGMIALIVRPFVHPTLYALPLALAAYRRPDLVTPKRALAFAALLTVVTTGLSALLYWRAEGDALFDGFSIPIIVVTGLINFAIVVVTFLAARFASPAAAKRGR